jgi:hypothetical protein
MHGTAHGLIESVAAVVLIAAGLAVLGLMLRRRRLGLPTSVVLSNPFGIRTALSIAVVPVLGLAFMALLLALTAAARTG